MVVMEARTVWNMAKWVKATANKLVALMMQSSAQPNDFHNTWRIDSLFRQSWSSMGNMAQKLTTEGSSNSSLVGRTTMAPSGPYNST